MVTLWMASLFVFAACHDDDDDDDKGYTPGKSVVLKGGISSERAGSGCLV